MWEAQSDWGAAGAGTPRLGGSGRGGFSQPLCDLRSPRGARGEDQEEDHFSFLSFNKSLLGAHLCLTLFQAPERQ